MAKKSQSRVSIDIHHGAEEVVPGVVNWDYVRKTPGIYELAWVRGKDRLVTICPYAVFYYDSDVTEENRDLRFVWYDAEESDTDEEDFLPVNETMTITITIRGVR